jgi:hypothetical protein
MPRESLPTSNDMPTPAETHKRKREQYAAGEGMAPGIGFLDGLAKVW